MITLKDIRPEGGSFFCSLTLLAGKIKDIRGFITRDSGGTPTFKLCDILFEDGTMLECEGAHDFAYVSTYGHSEPPNFDEATMKRLYNEDHEEYVR